MKSKGLQTRKTAIMKKFVAFLLLMSLTMVDFMFLGTEVVSYAADSLSFGTATNIKNVLFDAYFKNASGENVTSKEESISSKDAKLFMQIAVKNDGYFNGTVVLEESNFKLKPESSSEIINKIEGNKVTLNQINSGEVVEVEIGIEPLKEGTIGSGLLNMLSKVKIEGTYKSSTEKDKSVKATREVQLKLVSPYSEQEGNRINSEIITNKLYEIDGTNKRIVQVLVESGLIDNGYPVKENELEISVPNGVEEVEVNARGRMVTNGKPEEDFTKTNWTYQEKDQKINVSIKNDIENKTIRWMKNGKDSIIVTYVMPENVTVTGTEIISKSIVKLYDENETIKEATTTVKVAEEKDGIITTGVKPSETSIYKGKIYSGEDREYRVNEDIYYNSNKVQKNSAIEFSASTYETTAGEILANIQYKNTRINKSDIMRVLGIDGSLMILSAEGVTIAEINSDTDVDENGYITVNYPEGITAIKVTTTEAVDAGTISLDSTKIIKTDVISKETKRSYTAIVEKVTGAEAKIELKDTETRADITINKSKLSTLAKNENIEITATLVTSSEKYDLFKNPTFEIVLPELIKDINVKTIQPLFADMFNVVDTQVITGNNNSRIIKIVLNGEQTNYTANGTKYKYSNKYELYKFKWNCW